MIPCNAHWVFPAGEIKSMRRTQRDHVGANYVLCMCIKTRINSDALKGLSENKDRKWMSFVLCQFFSSCLLSWGIATLLLYTHWSRNHFKISQKEGYCATRSFLADLPHPGECYDISTQQQKGGRNLGGNDGNDDNGNCSYEVCW